jgi:hypothetical protein
MLLAIALIGFFLVLGVIAYMFHVTPDPQDR